MLINGTVVKLNSGGPLMTITDSKDKLHCCSWYNENNKLNTYWFNSECLTLVKKDSVKLLDIIKNYHMLISTENQHTNYLKLGSHDFTLEDSINFLNSVASPQDLIFSPNYNQINERLTLKNAYPTQFDVDAFNSIASSDKQISVFIHKSSLLSESTQKGIIRYLVAEGFKIHTVVHL